MPQIADLESADGAVFARLLARFFELSSAQERLLTDGLTECFAALYSDVPARRLALVREVIGATGNDWPDEVDAIGVVLRRVLSGTVRESRVVDALDLLRKLDDAG